LIGVIVVIGVIGAMSLIGAIGVIDVIGLIGMIGVIGVIGAMSLIGVISLISVIGLTVVTSAKQGPNYALTFPVFSLFDLTCTLTLPTQQLVNGLFDGMTHVMDSFLTGQGNPLMGAYWIATLKEFV
jgi:alcohol dehydrogenase YqhD (iron-dependent ADH family)